MWKRFSEKRWKKFFTMRGGRGFPQVGWKRFYKDMEGNRISTERSSWKGGRRSGTWTGPKSLTPISANGRTSKKCRAQQVSGSTLGHSDFSMVQTPPVRIRLSVQKEEDEGWKQTKNSPASQYVQACPDTGASTNVLNAKEAKRMGLKMTKTKVKLENASGSDMKVIGECVLYAQATGGKAQRIWVIISPDLKDKMLLGSKTSGPAPF